MNILYLTSADMVPGAPNARGDLWELEAHLSELLPAAASRGHHVHLGVWDDPQLDAHDVDLVIIGTPWDYAPRVQHFLSTLERLSGQAPVLNPLSVVRRNVDKTYLRDLADHGVPTVPTLWLTDIDEQAVQEANTHFGDVGVVVKKVVGAGAKGQVLWSGNGRIDPLPAGRVMVQPFLPSARTEGELSLVYFDGEFSHAAQKVPKAGDYRVQSLYGGTERAVAPDDEALRVAAACLRSIAEPLLYARVDLMRHEGTLRLMELELVEPYLYARQGPGMGERFFQALERLIQRGAVVPSAL